ncbi:MAG: hypothetical protein GWN58_28535 [Anaerolineae bacterium]|nr:hypothetical protein [Anaerolineae bacterium]
MTIPISCPRGTEPIGSYHTHPGGDPIPSSLDLRSWRDSGLPGPFCIEVPETGRVQCFRMDLTDI